jgi:hemolysin activation/secretion protein
MRGIKRNRIIGDGSAMANIELRYIFLDFMVLGQNLSIGTNLFCDMGLVTQKYDFAEENVPEAMRDIVFTGKDETLHSSAGLGLKISLNKNFTLSADWGKALNANDGESGFYVQMNYLF